jgi:DNA polymerase delta subunit 4
MPPKRKASGPTRSAQQSTLAFHGSSNKVTKSGTRAQRTKKDTTELPSAKISEPEVANVSSTEEVEATNDDVSAVTHPEQTVVAQAASSTPEEDEARKITEAKIKAYWKEKEKARKAPRVHQQDLSVHEKILREFDMSSHYGVSGSSR